MKLVIRLGWLMSTRESGAAGVPEKENILGHSARGGALKREREILLGSIYNVRVESASKKDGLSYTYTHYSWRSRDEQCQLEKWMSGRLHIVHRKLKDKERKS